MKCCRGNEAEEARKNSVVLIQAGAVVTYNKLPELLLDVDTIFVDDNTLSVHVSRPREKIDARHIKTIWGVGCQWVG